MKRNPVSLILGFYTEAAMAESGYREVRAAAVERVCLIQPDGTSVGKAHLCDRYSALRLEGESLVVTETEPANVEAVVQRLRQVGSPAVFIVREVPAITALPRTASEPLAGDQLKDFVVALARRHGKPGKPGHGPQLLAQLRKSESVIDEARTDLIEAARLDHALTAAAEWLLDNYYLIRTHAADIRRHLPRQYCKILPTLVSQPGDLRVSEVAKELVRQTDHTLNEANIVECLREYQTVEPLTIAEIWAFPLLLRLALIEALARLAARIREAQQLREAAYLWANRLAVSIRQGPEAFERILGQMESEPVALQSHFVACLAEQLQGEENALVPAQHWLEERLKMPLTGLVSDEHALEAAERVSISNAFRSLRTLSQLEFTKIFETVSLVEAELRRDPAGIYAKSDFSTRDRCRRVVEELSRNSEVAELEVSRKAVQLAANAGDQHIRHVAYYLLANGIIQLEAETHARMPPRQRFLRLVRRNATAVYLGGITVLSVCFLAIVLALAWETGVSHAAMLAVLGALAAFPLSELAIQIIHALVIALSPPDKLAKMNFRDGIPSESRPAMSHYFRQPATVSMN